MVLCGQMKENHTTKENEMSAYKADKIIEAIIDCNRFIEKEEKRNPDLRPKDMQDHLDYCKAHRVKLVAMLEGK